MALFRWIRRWIHYLTRPAILRGIIIGGAIEPRKASSAEDTARVFVFSYESLASTRETNTTFLDDFFLRLAKNWPVIWNESELSESPASTRVLVKINLNTADPYPASTDPQMLRVLLVFLRKMGFRQICVGDCASISAVPTRKVARKIGVVDAVSGLAELVCFDEQPWLTMETGLHHLPSITVPQALTEADFIIHLANMKTHSLADFSFGMKLGVGYMHPVERYALHKSYLQEKVAELAAAIVPDLTIVDGRKAFVCGGPSHGQIEAANLILAGRDSLAVDAETYKRLYELKQLCGCVEGFTEDSFAMRQLAHARVIGVGRASWQGYDVVEI